MRVRAARCTSLLAVSFCACAMPEPPGELVGAYHIEGALIENSCGAQALPAVDPLSFDVEIREQNQQGLWVREVPPARSGRLDQDGSFSFEFEARYPVMTTAEDRLESLIVADPEALSDPSTYDNLDAMPAQPCVLSVAERVQGRMLRDSRPDDGGETATPDAGSNDESDLIGENSIEVRALNASQCQLVLEDKGGPFLTLPCRVHYELTGELVE